MPNGNCSAQLKNSELIKQLEQLPCFNCIHKIEPIAQGLSHQCFKVTTVDGLFFAKYFENTAANNNSFQKELLLTNLAFEHQLTAENVYHDQPWLISRFISSPTLNKALLTTNEKVDRCLTVMVQCHQLPINVNISDVVDVFTPDKLIEQLKKECLLTQKQDRYLSQQVLLLIKPDGMNDILTQAGENSRKVICHGDLNYANVIIGKQNWLIDFECASIAAPEFDLAMMIAINEVSLTPNKETIKDICQQYRNKQSKSVVINDDEVTRYLLLCFIINGLWYLGQSIQRKDKSYRLLGENQFSRFDSIYKGARLLAQQMR
jgi:thiamine kinase-like enzyme